MPKTDEDGISIIIFEWCILQVIRMIQLRKRVLAKGTRVLDITVMSVTFFTSLYLYAPEEYPADVLDFLSLKIKLINIIAFFMLVIAWNRLFAFFGLYEVRRLGNRFREWWDIFKAVSISVMFFAAISFLTSRRNIRNEVLLTFWASCLVLTIMARTAVREYLVYLRTHGRNLRKVVFVGSGPRALDVAQKVMSRSELGYQLLGFVDDHFDTVQGKALPTAKRLCSLDEFPQLIDEQIVDEVFICLPIKSYYEKIRTIAHICQELGIVCRVPSDWFELKTGRSSAFSLNGIPMLTMYSGSEDQLEHLWIKRTMDIILSALALILFAPLLTFIALLIKVSSKGPVFFTQERVGFNRRLFKMIKFRTMVENAETLLPDLEHMNQADGPAFKIENDPRITRIGKWLRKTSLDELPQLINVLRGEMSLVGPRPLPLRDVLGIDERWQKRRFSMRPGLTCLWQVNGRHKVRFQEWMKLDLEYIDQWSLRLDLKIMLKTFPIMLKATGQ
jgi:exopolysaccharide biosynthesis polyprenyl glycosylphosphotransferase